MSEVLSMIGLRCTITYDAHNRQVDHGSRRVAFDGTKTVEASGKASCTQINCVKQEFASDRGRPRDEVLR